MEPFLYEWIDCKTIVTCMLIMTLYLLSLFSSLVYILPIKKEWAFLFPSHISITFI